MNDAPVIGLYEGAFLRCTDNNYELIGNKAAVIRNGEDTITYNPGIILRKDLTAA